jgi:hypothetical protein
MVTPAKLAVPSAEKGEAIPGDRSRSLLAATCQTIAQRLDATIQREPVGDRESVVKVEFPLTIGGAR